LIGRTVDRNPYRISKTQSPASRAIAMNEHSPPDEPGKQITQRTGNALGGPAPRTDLVNKIMAPFVMPIRRLVELRPLAEWLPKPDLRSKNPDEHDRREARERWQMLPDFKQLSADMNAFEEGWRPDTDELKARILIGLMLDCLPSAKTLPSASYIDGLVFTLLNDFEVTTYSGCCTYPPLAIAAAVKDVLKTMTFAPSPAEFLTIAQAKREEFRRFDNVAARLYDLREQCEGVLLRFGDIKPEPPEPGDMDDDIPF
jgi:hypothetical protein